MSTMAAAAFGNTISDVLGIGSAYYVEQFAQKIGFEAPKLTPIQLDLPKSRLAANLVSFLNIKYIFLNYLNFMNFLIGTCNRSHNRLYNWNVSSTDHKYGKT